jgi:N-acetylmuramoyl-L-alanine amidase
MKIAIRGGHCPKVPGASGILNEVVEDRKVKDAVIKYLRQLGHEVYDVTPPDSMSTVNGDLAHGVNEANRLKVDIFASIHFNAFNGTANGTEVCVYSPHDYAQRVVDNLTKLGFKYRGQKTKPNFNELRNTNMKAMIVEVCFVDSSIDAEIYKRVGHDAVGKAIAEGIVNQKVPAPTPAPSNSTGYYRVVCGSFQNKNEAAQRQAELKAAGFDSFLAYYEK